MLVRRPSDGSEIAIHQEQHALLSGVLAAAWRPALHGRLVAAITMHDAPWRAADAVPRRDERGRLVDFVSYPVAERLAFYRSGIDELEPVDPYIAYMVSLHYSSFAGMAKMNDFRAHEQARRDRLEPLIERTVRDDDLKWLQFFDVLSLHLCLTGPDVPPENLPVWLRDSVRWATTPDGRELALDWASSTRLHVDPWPFVDDELRVTLVVARDDVAESADLELRPAER